MSILREFKEFALKGNVVDLAVGVIIGAAFGKLVESMVGDLIMPVVSGLFGKIDFSNLFVILGSVPEGTVRTLDALRKAGVPVLAYGQFLTVTVNLLILAAVIFLMIRQINRLKRQQVAEQPVTPPSEPVVPEEVQLLRQIRDSLQSGGQR
jgi:large conductance mechanosensitive channel